MENNFNEILRDHLYTESGEKVSIDPDYFLVYFGADWCKDCVAAKEYIKNIAVELNSTYGNINMIFAGCARDQSNEDVLRSLKVGEYNIPYIKFEDREVTNINSVTYPSPRTYIPGFVLIKKDGTILSSSNGLTIDDWCLETPVEYFKNLMKQS